MFQGMEKFPKNEIFRRGACTSRKGGEKMFETLKRLYRDKSIGIEQLENAVTKEWITEEEMQEILGGGK